MVERSCEASEKFRKRSSWRRARKTTQMLQGLCQLLQLILINQAKASNWNVTSSWLACPSTLTGLSLTRCLFRCLCRCRVLGVLSSKALQSDTRCNLVWRKKKINFSRSYLEFRPFTEDCGESLYLILPPEFGRAKNKISDSAWRRLNWISNLLYTYLCLCPCHSPRCSEIRRAWVLWLTWYRRRSCRHDMYKRQHL